MVGLLLIGAGVVGLIISLAGLFIGLPTLSAAEETLNSRIADLDQALIAAADGLNVADSSLASATETITAIETTVRSSGQAISDTLPTIDRVGTLVGVEIPRAIRSTQQTLASARETARVADAVLGAISRIGLLGANTYNPDVPLNQAIQQVSDSLDPLPASLSGVRDRLTITSANLRRIGANTEAVAENIADINAGFRDARQVINRYQTLVTDLQAEIAALRAALPVWFGAARALLAILSIWFALAQFALFAQGISLLRQS
jgi:septal ring factor EnvC (AmiA/AmiB activator)